MDLTKFSSFCLIQIFVCVLCQTTSQPAPEAPTDLKLVKSDTNSLTITWNGIAGSYDVAISPNQGQAGTPETQDSSSWTYTHTELTPGTQYEFSITATEEGISSPPTNNSFFTKPNSPILTRADLGMTNTLNISWTKPTGGCGMVELSMKGITEIATGQSHNFKDLEPGKKYKITAVCIVGNIERSQEGSQDFYTKPLAVKELDIGGRTNNSITVTWKNSTSDQFYEIIQVELQGKPLVTLDKGAMNHTFENLDPGTTYSIRLKTISDDQESDAVQRNITTKPESPTNLAQSGESETTVSVMWTSVSDQNKISGYTIRLLKGTSVIATNTSTNKAASAHQFDNLEPGTKYEVYLQCFLQSENAKLESSQINANIYTAPSPPKNLVITSKLNTNLGFSWEAPEHGADEYKVDIKHNMNTTTFELIETSLQESNNLRAGATYLIEVSSVKYKKISTTLSRRVVLIPLPPDGVRVEGQTTTSVMVIWTPPQASEVSKYTVEWETNGATKTFNVTGTTHTITGLSEGQVINIKVFSVNEDGDRSLASADAMSKTLEGVLTITQESETTTSVTFSWSEPMNSAIERYELSIMPNPKQINLPVNVDSSSAKMYTFNGLIPGSSYQLTVKASAPGGGIAGSETIDVFTSPEIVESLRANEVTSTEIFLTWTPGKGITQKYEVTYSSKLSGEKTLKIDPRVPPYPIKMLTPGDSYPIKMLTPGDSYEITVKTVSNDKYSDPSKLNITTVPLPVTKLQVTVNSQDMVTMSWTPNKTGVQDTFLYSYRPVDGGFVKWSNSSDTKTTIPSLMPGQTYIFVVRARSKNMSSTILEANGTLYPLAPVDLKLVNKTTNSAKFRWMKDATPSVVTGWEFSSKKSDDANWNLEYLNENENSKELQNLTPGALYRVEVRSLSGSMKSQGSDTMDVRLKPVIKSMLQEDALTSTTSISFIYTESIEGVFDKYKFTLTTQSDDPGPKMNEKPKDDLQRRVLFSNLIPGTVYTITAVTVSGTEESSPLPSLNITTVPAKPNVGATQLSKSLTLNIEPEQGHADYYIITYLGSSSEISQREKNVTAEKSAQITSEVYSNLTPNTKFQFSVFAWKNDKRSIETRETFVTKEDKPGRVSVMKVEALTPNSVKVSWDKPLSPNGIITGYSVYYKHLNDNRSIVKNNITAQTMVLENLEAGATYSFNVSAWTKVGEGPPVEQVKETLIWGPKLHISNQSAMPKVMDDVNDSAFEMSFINPFSDLYGKVVAFTIIVSTNKSLVGDRESLTTWSVAHRKKPMGIYQVMERCPLFDSGNECRLRGAKRSKRSTPDEVMFTIGAEQCEESDLDTYCNGPVRPSSQYFVKLRGYTALGNYTETPYSEPINTARDPRELMLLKILLPIFIIVIIAVAVIAVLIVQRRRKAERNSYLEDVYLQKRRKPVESSRPIAVSHFLERVKELSADADFQYSEEFEDLKNVGRDQPTNAAEFPVNRNKNRFTNILPYEHSRVKLLPTDDEEGSDYINANYVPGYNSKREFIACQGPLPSTKDDFWRMVWEQNARAIVMLTRCVEKGREKCDHYWPVDSEPVFYGDLQAAILNETQTPEWDIREFTISKGQTSRKLTHFHYTAWPDFGVPGQPRSLVLFVQLIRERLDSLGGPIIVHCSAGVGRSGTYISLDTLLQQLKEGCESVDIFGVVYAMRLQRVCMVQTEQQYICIHNCLACVLGDEEESEEEEPGEDNEGYEGHCEDFDDFSDRSLPSPQNHRFRPHLMPVSASQMQFGPEVDEGIGDS